MGKDWHRIFVFCRIIINNNPRELTDQPYYIINVEILFKLNVHSLWMSADNGNPHNCRSYLDCLIFEYFTGFVKQFLFLGCISIGLKCSSMWKAVFINLICISHLTLYSWSFILHLGNSLYTGTGYWLICCNYQTPDFIFTVKRSQCHNHLYRWTVWISDYPVTLLYYMTVDFRNDQRNIFIHSPVRGVVNHNSSVFCKNRSPFLWCWCTCWEDGKFRSGFNSFHNTYNLDSLSLKNDLFTNRPLRSSR